MKKQIVMYFMKSYITTKMLRLFKAIPIYL